MKLHLNENIIIAVAFCLCIYLVYKPLRKSLLSFLDNKIADISAKFTELNKLKQEASDLLKETENSIARFNSEKE